MKITQTYTVARFNQHGFLVFAMFDQDGHCAAWTGNVDAANHFMSMNAAQHVGAYALGHLTPDHPEAVWHIQGIRV